jgi:hypothetical protein
MAQDLDTALWIKPDGLERRLSDGIPSLAALETTALHVMGWIEVERTGMLTRVTLDPYAVRYDALMRLPDVLGTRFRGRAVDVALAHRGMSHSARVSFFSTTAAITHINEQVIIERGDLDHEPPIDRLAKGMGESRAEPQREAKPAPLPNTFESASGRSRETDKIRANLEEDSRARPIGELEGALQSGVAVARRLIGGAWLTDEHAVVPNLRDELRRDEPDMILFALHTRGWVGVEMDFPSRGGDLRAELPARIVMDPHVVSLETLRTLMTFCNDWAESPGVITLVWWDGISWVMEYGSADQLAARARHLIEAKRSAFFPSTPQSIAMDPDNFAIQDLAGREMFDRALRIWRAHGGRLDKNKVMMNAFHSAEIFKQRTKLLNVDENNEFRISHYAPGERAIWTTKEISSMIGRRLIDVPDRKLGASVQNDLLTVLRWDRPLVHRCEGVVDRTNGPTKVSWSRLTLPLRSTTSATSLLTVINVDEVDEERRHSHQ